MNDKQFELQAEREVGKIRATLTGCGLSYRVERRISWFLQDKLRIDGAAADSMLLSELVNHITEQEAKLIRGFGKDSVSELKKTLESIGLKLQ